MVFDLHCDLLAYLGRHPYNSAFDTESRASIPQLLEGDVATQALPIYVATSPSSVKKALKQVARYKQLQKRYEGYFAPFRSGAQAKIQTLLAFENASGLVGDSEKIEEGVLRLQKINETCEKPLYISLTWHHENRFGGGNYSIAGLKKDGKEFLKKACHLFHAVDLSHTSDALAGGILEYVEKEKLPLKVMCSHSNFRKVHKHVRNITDEYADVIVSRGGIIGLNLIHDFVGTRIEDVLRHIEHGLKRGYENALAIGADFFCELDVPAKDRGGPHFYEGFDTSACYPKLFRMIEKEFGAKIAQKIRSDNAKRFILSF